jgi:hypothetical protein
MRFKELEPKVILKPKGWKDKQNSVWYLATNDDEGFNKIFIEIILIIFHVVECKYKINFIGSRVNNFTFDLLTINNMFVCQLNWKSHLQLFLPNI